MAPEATVPPGDVNVPGDYFSLAGFEVTTYGRFWVTPEAAFEETFDFRARQMAEQLNDFLGLGKK
jgi:hypothetical protein